MNVAKRLIATLSILLTIACGDASAHQYGQPNLIGGIVGNLLLNAQMNNARKAWSELDPNVLQCINTESGTNVAALVSQGIMPYDYRVGPLIQACRNQILTQQAQVAQQAQEQAEQQAAAQQAEAAQAAAQQEAAQQAAAAQSAGQQEAVQPAAAQQAPAASNAPVQQTIPINPLTGPSFPCPQPQDPLAELICTTPQLALLDMQFVQAYEALYQQAGAAGDIAVRNMDIQSELNIRSKCGIALSQAANPSGGIPPAAPNGSAACVIGAYQQQIATWKSMLQEPAMEEANRPIAQQVALQARLQALGFLPTNAQLDGIFGKGTRTAIEKWQTSQGREPTGLLSNDDANALLGNSSPTVALPTGGSEVSSSESSPQNTVTNDNVPTDQTQTSQPPALESSDSNLADSSSKNQTANPNQSENQDQDNSDLYIEIVLSILFIAFLAYSAYHFLGRSARTRPRFRDKNGRDEEENESSSDYFADETNDQYEDRREENHAQDDNQSNQAGKTNPSWYEVLGVRPNANLEEIREAWREGLKKYHPDLVATLGPKLREVAESECKALNRAYELAVSLRK